MHSRPHIGELRRLTDSQANGEFIAVTDGLEIHIYLQQGRIAWGTSSAKRFAFVRHLFESCDIDESSFREVVEVCRQEGKPLGETLVEWGLATSEQVRGALRSQVLESLQDLASVERAQTLFLRRDRYSDYDERLTFRLDEVLSAIAPKQAEGTSKSSRDEARQLAERLRALVPEVLWIEVADPFGSQRVPETAPGVAAALAPATLGAGAGMAAIRAGVGTIVGVGLPWSDRTVWCGLGNDCTIGNVLAALATAVGVDCTRHAGPPGPGGDWREVGDNQIDNRRLREFVSRAAGLSRALVLDAGSVWGMEKGDEHAAMAALARARVALLRRTEIADALSGAGLDTDSLGYGYRSMVVADDHCWSYYAEIPESGGRALWLGLDRQQSQGMGWALLTSLLRQMTA